MHFAIDRLATVCFFYPLQRLLLGTTVKLQIPILMYHSISAGQEHEHSYYATSTTREVFAAHLDFLRANQYVALNLSQAADILASGKQLDKKFVVITFDDGFADFFEDAFPVLKEHGFTATMFLPTDYIGNSSKSFKGRPCLTWDQIKELHRGGIEFGSHTASHPRLVDLAPKTLETELKVSKEVIEQRLSSPVHSFAYPYAFPEHRRSFTSLLRDALQDAGYQQGVTTKLGIAGMGDERLFLKRLPVNSYDDQPFLKAKLEGGYNWLRGVQYGSKILRAALP
jgi:peptidoglycan/xylan/chitin deacetylase (PgdA/CDA1 family)